MTTASTPPEPAVTVLHSAAEVEHRVGELAAQIADSMGEELLLVCILKGSFMFTADLMRALHHQGVRPRVDFLTVSSYGAGTTSSGTLELLRDIDEDVRSQKVLLVDDVLDTGRTLRYARDTMLDRGAAEVRSCVLLDKPARRAVTMTADFTGFHIPDVFVVGYGLDYAHRFRELPYIGQLPEDAG